MTWQVITANESVCVDMPFDVVPRAAELLIQNGWTPPTETQELVDQSERQQANEAH